MVIPIIKERTNNGSLIINLQIKLINLLYHVVFKSFIIFEEEGSHYQKANQFKIVSKRFFFYTIPIENGVFV